MVKSKTILVVDDEPRTRQGLTRMLETWGNGACSIISADNGRDALDLLEREAVHLLITDIRMPEISGLNLVQQLESGSPAIILISGYAEFDYAQQAIQLGVVNYLLKPIRKDKLFDAVEKALQIQEERSRMNKIQRMVDSKLLEAAGDTDTLAEPVQEALQYVSEHLDQGFGLREVADHVHLNPSYFSVLFKEQMDMTFIEYVTRLRIQKAKELLLQTKLPVSEIAERVGYQTTKYFNKVFKDYEGSSPGAYRKGGQAAPK
ncbi:YesN/AraC family two-component response regulator [Paenibacillus rhizosphaerae]|uniref:YesN/AraC family two-component response regulator n=1 Tax=Paenibacillus rhizosphaerae TaxID=297318 RepID=A0A839TQH8_9BACL|nr:response regulator [Paenibacillus rhizosphaerae]MBB3129254.1 YesN/AraC family two-component response regulator [Paenibacillus rhizosphaerae]